MARWCCFISSYVVACRFLLYFHAYIHIFVYCDLENNLSRTHDTKCLRSLKISLFLQLNGLSLAVSVLFLSICNSFGEVNFFSGILH